MGSYYGSIQVRCDDREALRAAVEDVARECFQKFLVGPVMHGWVGVYPDGSGQSNVCAQALAKRLNQVVLQLIVHHDDVFIYNFFRQGEWVQEYSSNPDGFEMVSAAERERLAARPEIFRELVADPGKLAQLAGLLEVRDKAAEFTAEIAFEQDRLEEFARLLGIQNALTCYEYLMAGEREGIRQWKQFVHVPDLTAEKAAQKAAAAALRREKLVWQKDGRLVNECRPPGPQADAAMARVDFCPDPVQGGFLMLWKLNNYRYQRQLQHLQPPWPKDPPVLELTGASARLDDLAISSRGRWFAYFDGRLRLWDWRNRRRVEELESRASPVAFSPDEQWLLCRESLKFSLLEPGTGKTRLTFRLPDQGTQVYGIHPANSFLLTGIGHEELGMVSLESGKLVKVLFAAGATHAVKLADETVLELPGWESVLNAKFSPDGERLFCATSGGLRVYAWRDLLAAGKRMPEPVFAVTPHPGAIAMSPENYENYIYDLVLDEGANRLLFGGLEGVIRYLNLNNGSTGILVDPPGKSRLSRLELSHDRNYLCSVALEEIGERAGFRPRLQVWNYAALCRKAGI